MLRKYFNKFACYSATDLPSQWNESAKSCVDFVTPFDMVNCDANLNRIACLKVTKAGQTCKWSITKMVCEFLVVDDKIICEALAKSGNQFNVNTCITVYAPGSYCTYDFKNLTCEYRKCDKDCDAKPSFIKVNELCDQRYLNIHACLSSTKNQFCEFDPVSLKCK